MTQQELEAGADGVMRVAAKYGYASYIGRDKAREIAAEVIQAVDAERNTRYDAGA